MIKPKEGRLPANYLIIAAALLATTVWFSIGHHQSDEHYQILEFAGYKLGYFGADALAWEFGEQMRPALQPAMAYVAYKIMGLGGEADPFHVGYFLRLLSAAFSLWVWVLIYRRYATRIESSNLVKWFAIFTFFHWIAYYNGVRFSSENWSGLVAVLGLLTYPFQPAGTHVFTPASVSTGAGSRVQGVLTRSFAAGVLFGLAFLFRYQIALMVGGFGLWMLFIERANWKKVIAVIAGGLLALAVCYPLTYWLYGEWTSPAWNYFASNLIEGKAATYGTRPWWGYLELVFLRGIPPLSLVYLGSFFAFAWYFRRDPVTWMTVAFVVVHSYLARKDVRFLFPLLPLVPVLVLGTAHKLDGIKGADFWHKRWVKFTVGLLTVVNFVLLVTVLFRPAASEMVPLKFVYDNYPEQVQLAGPGFPIDRVEGAHARFFERPGKYELVKSYENCTGEVTCLIALHSRGTPEPPQGSKLVYTDRPPWIETVNFLGWADKEKWWYVYEFAP